MGTSGTVELVGAFDKSVALAGTFDKAVALDGVFDKGTALDGTFDKATALTGTFDKGIALVGCTSHLSTSWWTAGGASCCVGAYQPKGAASLAASYLDLSGNGNDAGVGVAPTWDAVNGWKFNGINQYLDAGFVPDGDQSQSILLQFSNRAVKSGVLFGIYIWFTTQYVHTRYSHMSDRFEYGNCGSPKNGPSGSGIDAGNVGIAGAQGFKNGTSEVDTLQNTNPTYTESLIIGGIRLQGSGIFQYMEFDAQAFAIYNCTLTDLQFLAVKTAMAAI